MELIITSIIAFAGSNIDDVFVLMLFFGNKAYKKKDVVIGQFLGIGALISVSFVGSLAELIIDTAYIGLLGFLPIFIGVKSLVLHVNKRGLVEEEEEKTAVSSNKSAMLSVAAVTIANGGDNIGIYVPLFATLSIASKLIMILIFLLLILPWCFIAMYLVKHPAVAKAIDKYGDIITPILFILLGLYILFESGTVRMFSNLVQ